MKMKVVKFRDRMKVLYSVRLEDSVGTETEVAVCDNIGEAEAIVIKLREVEDAAQGNETFMVLVSTLLMVGALAYKISASGDQVGELNYATKSHMRIWAQDIFEAVNGSIEMIAASPKGSLAKANAAVSIR